MPQGCRTLADAPHDLIRAIEHAFWVLSLQENLTSEEMPPAWMWPFDKAIEEHLEMVDKDRKERFGRGGDDDEDDTPAHRTHSVQNENELVAQIKRDAGIKR